MPARRDTGVATAATDPWPAGSASYESAAAVCRNMAEWLESGTRRDMCVLLYEAGELRGQELKRRLEDHYGDRIRPKRFQSRLEALVSGGYVDARTEGIEDVYVLTDAGARAVEAHFEWMHECVDGE